MHSPLRVRLTTPARPRHGAALIFAMIALLIVSMIGGGILNLTVAQHRQAQQEQVRLQAEWLADAALERAAARLAQSADYTGETWHISAAALGGDAPGRVQIDVARRPDRPGLRALTIVASYPGESPQRARVEKQVFVQVEAAPEN